MPSEAGPRADRWRGFVSHAASSLGRLIPKRAKGLEDAAATGALWRAVNFSPRAQAFTAMPPGSLREDAQAFDRTQMPWQSVTLPQSQDKPPLARLALTAYCVGAWASDQPPSDTGEFRGPPLGVSSSIPLDHAANVYRCDGS